MSTSTLLVPPGPPGRFIVGNLPELRRDPLGNLSRWAKEYGDVVHLSVANIDAYFLSHPDLVEDVLVTQNRSFMKPRLLRDAGELLGNGLLTSDGDLWLRQRRLAQPAFHRERINAYASIMTSHTDTMLATWRDGEEIDVHEAMMALTLGIVAESLFDTDVSRESDDFAAALEVALQRFVDRMSFMRIFDSFPLPRNRRFQRASARLDEIIYRVIDEHQSSGHDSGDLLSMLLAARDDDGSRMGRAQLRDEVLTLFLAGHETTAISLSWTWLLLGQNPDVRLELERELDEVLGGRLPTLEDMPRLKYTDMVVKESMRLYPPAWRVGREAIEEVEVGGYPMAKGSQVFMSQWVIHRDPRFWEEPERFMPERWRDEGGGMRDESEKRKPSSSEFPRYAYFPFGGGQRRCIGDMFAMMEATLILATIAQRFRLEIVPTHPIGMFPSITLRPKYGIRVVVKNR